MSELGHPALWSRHFVLCSVARSLRWPWCLCPDGEEAEDGLLLPTRDPGWKVSSEMSVTKGESNHNAVT